MRSDIIFCKQKQDHKIEDLSSYEKVEEIAYLLGIQLEEKESLNGTLDKILNFLYSHIEHDSTENKEV